MFFSKLARLFAIAAFALGLSQALLGLSISTGALEPYEVVRARFLGSKSPGQAIDWGIYTILVAVALGTLAEISFSMRK
jgi:hypothetical protein